MPHNRPIEVSMMCNLYIEDDYYLICWPAISMFSVDTLNNVATWRQASY